MSKVLMLQRDFLIFGFLMLLCAVVALPSLAAEAGRVKVSKGDVQIERDGKRLAAPVGAMIQARDTVKTGPDGSVGITFQTTACCRRAPTANW